jgi:hypothetical protein
MYTKTAKASLIWHLPISYSLKYKELSLLKHTWLHLGRGLFHSNYNIFTRLKWICLGIRKFVVILLATFSHAIKKKQNSVPGSASELHRLSDCLMSAKSMPTFEDRGCHMVNMMDPYSHIHCFLDWSHYFFFQVASQLYSRGWVDPVPDPLLLRKSGSTGNRTRTSGSVARNSGHQATEAVNILPHSPQN